MYVLESAGGGVLRALSYGLNGEGLPQLASAATSAEIVRLHLGLAARDEQRHDRRQRGRLGRLQLRVPNGGGSQLRAYAAIPSGGTLPLLWSGKIGKSSKFSVPTAYEGRVYVGTRNGQLIAFGSSAAAPVQAGAVDAGSVEVGESRALTLPVSATRNVTVTGPVTVEGVEAASGAPSAGDDARTPPRRAAPA